ncbi:MAG: hypothetical protein ACE5NP_09920 [Anaerolineae bacterium]
MAKRKKQPILYYRRTFRQLLPTGLLLILLTAGLLVWDPPELEQYRPVLQLILALAALLLLLTFAMARLAHVQVDDKGVHLQLPFYRFDLSYDDIQNTRPAPLYQLFPPEEQSWSTRQHLEPLYKLTAVVVRVKKFRRPRWWLRLWLGDKILVKNGIVLVVKDWMSLRRAIGEESSARRLARM